MDVKTVGFTKDWVLVETVNKDCPEKRFLPKTLIPTSVKGLVLKLPEREILSGLNYSDIDWSELPAISGKVVCEFKKSGLWRKSDFKKNLKITAKILNDHAVDIDIFDFLNMIEL